VFAGLLLVAAGTKPELESSSLNPVITRFMRVIQQPRVCGAKECLSAMDIALLDCPDTPGNDGVAGDELQPRRQSPL
jgi:hypothetical protein